MEQTRAYRPEKVAELADCTVQTIYRHLDEGKFPNAYRIGNRKWVIPEEDATSYLGFNPYEKQVTIL